MIHIGYKITSLRFLELFYPAVLQKEDTFTSFSRELYFLITQLLDLLA
jgi:hypothetical protein